MQRDPSFMLFGTPIQVKHANAVEIKFNNIIIEPVISCKYLGVFIDSSLNFAQHTDVIARKVNAKIAAIGRVRNYLQGLHAYFVQILHSFSF